MRKIFSIGLHHSASAENTSVETITKWHADRGISPIGYNYVIRRLWGNGPWTIEVGRPIEKIPAAHRYELDVPNIHSWSNTGSVAICVCGKFHEVKLPDEALDLLANLCAHLMLMYDISESNIFGHNDVKKTLCPGYSVHIVRRAACLKLSELTKG